MHWARCGFLESSKTQASAAKMEPLCLRRAVRPSLYSLFSDGTTLSLSEFLLNIFWSSSKRDSFVIVPFQIYTSQKFLLPFSTPRDPRIEKWASKGLCPAQSKVGWCEMLFHCPPSLDCRNITGSHKILAAPQFLHLKKGNSNNPYLTGILKDEMS